MHTKLQIANYSGHYRIIEDDGTMNVSKIRQKIKERNGKYIFTMNCRKL